MERANDARLQELRDSGKEIYSISRLDSINNCLYMSYRTYILGDRGSNNIYAIMGSRIHDVLEQITNGEATEKDLLPALQQELEDMEMFGIAFPKDSKGGDAIRQGWITNMEHFCNTYKKPNGKFETEQLFIYESPNGNYVQGYIDLQKIIDENNINIYDYKTSTMYKGEDIKHHGRQLVTYLMGKEQEGYTVGDVAWIFLKYVDVTFLGKKTVKSKELSKITKTIERKKLASELAGYVEKDLLDMGMDEFEVDILLTEFRESNSLDCLPEEVRSKYKFTPCVSKYVVTDEVKKECEEYIDNTIAMWESLGGKDHPENYKPKKFTKVQKNGKQVPDIFFCTNLCSHFKNCPHIHEYLAMLDTKKNDDEDLF